MQSPASYLRVPNLSETLNFNSNIQKFGGYLLATLLYFSVLRTRDILAGLDFPRCQVAL